MKGASSVNFRRRAVDAIAELTVVGSYSSLGYRWRAPTFTPIDINLSGRTEEFDFRFRRRDGSGSGRREAFSLAHDVGDRDFGPRSDREPARRALPARSAGTGRNAALPVADASRVQFCLLRMRVASGCPHPFLGRR